ncbi:MAG: hypothetical protein E7269_04820 [Lachnospiraceae bacterium]|nr:hypothetical protein [Lachnospiraceae bacterium]
MNAQKLKKMILSLAQDITFLYEEEYACINPWNSQKIEVGYGNKVKIYNDIDEVMTDKFYHGKALEDICETLIIE